jgi:hypothetical protein
MELLNSFRVHRYARAVAVWIVVFLAGTAVSFAQDDLVEYTLNTSGNTIALPQCFRPSLDLSGRGFHPDPAWPQSVAASEAIDVWHNEFGACGFYRIQLNLWEVSMLERNPALQREWTQNYEALIRRISDAGGTVIVDIFSTPPGTGKIFDKKSAPVDLVTFKRTVKEYMRYFSCIRKYSVWYEVWSAPDLDDFFIGRQQEYLNIYKAVAECSRELKAQYKVNIPVGGPSSSWWYRGFESSATILVPERSLIYELIKFCYQNKLPLDFISWHAYTSDPKAEKELTAYNKTAVSLIQEWLTYFHFTGVSLVVDEWNFDAGLNKAPERNPRAAVGASFIPCRLKHMFEAGLDRQVFFCLEDFQDNKEGVERNVGAFGYEPGLEYRGIPKKILSVFRMLNSLGGTMFIPSANFNDEFVGVIATSAPDAFAVLVYNYIDPDIFKNYLSRNIAVLKDAERAAIVSLVKSEAYCRVASGEKSLDEIRLPGRSKTFVKKALELARLADKYRQMPRRLRLTVKGKPENYTYQEYRMDDSTNPDTGFVPFTQGEFSTGGSIDVELAPYSVRLYVFKKMAKKENPPEIAAPQISSAAQVAAPASAEAVKPAQEAVMQSGSAELAPAEQSAQDRGAQSANFTIEADQPPQEE